MIYTTRKMLLWTFDSRIIMIIDKITSRQNPLVKRFRAVREGQERHLLFIEGIRLLEEAIEAGLHFEAVAFSDRLQATSRGVELYQKILHLSCRGALVANSVLDAISDVETPQGVAAIAHIPYATLEKDAINRAAPLIIVAHQLQDPGNLGAIIRTGEAVGVDSLITTLNTVSPFNIKALRAAMGSAFRLPIITNTRINQIAEFCHKANIQLVAADLVSKRSYTDLDWQKPTAVLIGQEGNGLDEVASKYAQEIIHIPMMKPVESLNVATAVSVLLYEAARQRSFKFC